MGFLPDPTVIDAVILDAGGVLLLPDLVAGREALRAIGCDPNQEHWVAGHYRVVAAIDAMDTPDSVALRRVFASAIGVDPDQLDAAVPIIEEITVSTPWMAVDTASGALRRLSEAGYLLAVVSNSTGTVAEQLEAAGICSERDEALPRVAIIVDSHLVGIEKPEPGIFRFALDVLDVRPQRAVFVGDTVKFDVNGAIAADLLPVHLEPFNRCQGDHAHVRSLVELVDWLAPR